LKPNTSSGRYCRGKIQYNMLAVGKFLRIEAARVLQRFQSLAPIVDKVQALELLGLARFVNQDES